MNEEGKFNNVLKFPTRKNKFIKDIQSIEEMNIALAEHKEAYIDMVLTYHMNNLYAKIAFDGFDTEDKQFFTDFSFMVEALKSAMLRQCKIEHPLQNFVDENFEICQDDEGNNNE
jgi:hypothetical protein